MPNDSSLFLQSLLFSSVAVGVVVLSIWWLYLSPLKARVGQPAPPSPRLAYGLAALLSFSAIQLTAGAFWDGSMHILTGVIPAGEDFLWPPHLMIYSSFLISLIVALGALALVALPAWRAGERDPRLWVRRSPYLGAVMIASLYSLTSVPADALWHALYGIDLTAWSPPHVMIIVSMGTVLLCAVGVLMQVRPVRFDAIDYAVPLLLSLGLNVVFIIGTIEWELWGGGPSLLVQRNPIWVYPLVGGLLAFAFSLLSKQLSRWRWAATLTAIGFFALRLAIAFAMNVTHNVVPYLPPLFVLGAILLDVIPWERLANPLARMAGMAVVFTVGYGALALPMLATRAHLPRFAPADFVIALIALLIGAGIIAPIIQWVGDFMLGRSALPPPATPGVAPAPSR
jgi:hypothetical protein